MQRYSELDCLVGLGAKIFPKSKEEGGEYHATVTGVDIKTGFLMVTKPDGASLSLCTEETSVMPENSWGKVVRYLIYPKN